MCCGLPGTKPDGATSGRERNKIGANFPARFGTAALSCDTLKVTRNTNRGDCIMLTRAFAAWSVFFGSSTGFRNGRIRTELDKTAVDAGRGGRAFERADFGQAKIRNFRDCTLSSPNFLP